MSFTDGSLLQYPGAPDLWGVFDGVRVRLGHVDSNVLDVIRRSRAEVIAVDLATLSSIPTAPFASLSDIPGSLVFPPLNDEFGSELGRHFVIRTRATTRVVSQGRELRSITLRGWLYPLPNDFVTHSEPGWDDWHYWLEVDSAWASDAGIDLNAIMRVGNFAEHQKTRVAGTNDFFTWAGTAWVHLEINGWKPANARGVPRPSGWTFGTAPGFTNTNPDTLWPFDPRFPADSTNPPYVETSGSLIADRSHVTRGWQSWSAVGWWRRGISNDAEDSPIRATEIHPPDRIVVLDPTPRRENLFGIALVAGSGLFDAHRQEITAIFSPPGSPPSPAHYAVVTELVGPESYLDTVVLGNATKTGAAITYGDSAVRVQVAVGTRLWGKVGKFKALYRVRWERVSVQELIAVGSSLFLPPAVQFGLRSPRRPTLSVRLEVRHEDGPWYIVVSEDPLNLGALVGAVYSQAVQSNSSTLTTCFWWGRTANGPPLLGVDGQYTFRLSVLRVAGGVATSREASTTINWGRIRVTCASRARSSDGRRRIVVVGGAGWRLPVEDLIRRIEAGAEYYVERPEGDDVSIIVAEGAAHHKYVRTEADGDEPNNLLALPECG